MHNRGFLYSACLLLFLGALSCNANRAQGEWRTELSYTDGNGQTASEHFVLLLDHDGRAYKNGTYFGTYRIRAKNRLKIYSHDRKLVFNGKFIGSDRLQGDYCKIPSDQVIARWTADKQRD